MISLRCQLSHEILIYGFRKLVDQTSECHEMLTGIFWRFVLMKNHTGLLLATPSMCQSWELLIHVLAYAKFKNYKKQIRTTTRLDSSVRIKSRIRTKVT